MKLRHFTPLFVFATGLFVLSGCETPPSSSGNSEWRQPPRYGSGGGNSSSSRDRSDSSSGNNGSSRFGYSGNESSRPDTSSNTSRERDRDDSDDVVINDKPKKEETTSSGSGNLGFAIGVPGNPLSVTLPGSAKSLGPISIEKYDAAGKPTGDPLPRGTPVEIPDPSNPGKKIQFKVP